MDENGTFQSGGRTDAGDWEMAATVASPAHNPDPPSPLNLQLPNSPFRHRFGASRGSGGDRAIFKLILNAFWEGIPGVEGWKSERLVEHHLLSAFLETSSTWTHNSHSWQLQGCKVLHVLPMKCNQKSVPIGPQHELHARTQGGMAPWPNRSRTRSNPGLERYTHPPLGTMTIIQNIL